MARILVADDEASVCAFVGRALTQRGHEVTTVPDGLAALAALAGAPFDLLLTDMRMPFMGGGELASQLRRRRGSLKLLCISGYAGGNELEFTDDFLAKPFSREQLLAKVREILDRP